MFACAHPAIDPAIRAPLMLQTVLGFDAAAIASAFLVSPASHGPAPGAGEVEDPAGRHSLCAFRDRAEMPRAAGCRAGRDLRRLRRRLVRSRDTDIHVAIWRRKRIWLGRLVVSLLPDEPEALGLLALMLHAEARHAARRDADGGFVPLAEQDVARWDGGMIEEAETLLRAPALWA